MSPLSAHELGFKDTKHNCAAIWWLDVGNQRDHGDKNKLVRSELKTYRLQQVNTEEMFITQWLCLDRQESPKYGLMSTI